MSNQPERRDYRLDTGYITESLEELKSSVKELSKSVQISQADMENRVRSLEYWRAGVDAATTINQQAAAASAQGIGQLDMSLLLKIILGVLALAGAALGLNGTGLV